MLRIIFGGILILLFTACSKKEPVLPGNASLMIVHALPDAADLKTIFSTNFTGFFKDANAATYGNFEVNRRIFKVPGGTVPLRLFQMPDTLPKNTPLYDLALDMPVGAIKTLFLCGTAAAPEHFVTTDELPYFPAGDSSMGIRFVNLLQGNIPVTVNLITQPSVPELSNLPYKSITAFKKYAVRMNVSDYVFECRNANTGDLITTYTTEQIANDGKLTRNNWIFKNFTMTLIGKAGGTGVQEPKIMMLQNSGL